MWPLAVGVILVAVVSGAGIIAAEIIALDAIQFVATMSFYAPAVVLATVLGVLALSAFIVPRISDRSVDSTMLGRLIGAGLDLTLSQRLRVLRSENLLSRRRSSSPSPASRASSAGV